MTERIIDYNSNFNHGKIPFHDVVITGDEIDVKRYLAYGVDVDTEDEDGKTPLQHAIQFAGKDRDNFDIIKILLKAGAQVNKPANIFGYTALHWAASNIFTPVATVEILIKANANTEAKDMDGNTPLHVAAKNNRPDVIKGLLDAGAEKNAQNHYGYTPLHFVASRVSPQAPAAMRTLLEAGADPEIKDTAGKTARFRAETNSFFTTSNVLQEIGGKTHLSDLTME